jgi:hypothetical protein
MHHFLNIYLREGDLITVSETPRDLPLCNTDHITLTVVYTVVILVTSCITACTLQTPGKLHMCNNVPYFSIDKAHLMYNAHPKLFRHSF